MNNFFSPSFFFEILKVRACIQEDRWLDPAPFEITDFLPPMVINRASKNGHTHESRPLEGVTVFISRKRPLKPTAENLQRMVLQAAGKVSIEILYQHVVAPLIFPHTEVLPGLSVFTNSDFTKLESSTPNLKTTFNIFRKT